MTTTPEEHPDLETRLAEIAVDLHGFTPERTIERIAETTRIMLAADGAGVLVVRARRRVETAAATDESVRRAHALQVELDEGCRSSWTRGRVSTPASTTASAGSTTRLWTRVGPAGTARRRSSASGRC